jgi:UDP-2,3-diacylglucosamine pyrophosphatase LpxH
VRTLIVSDLHLGSATGADVLRVPKLRIPLLEAARNADRVVLLGDLLELRDRQPGDVLELARPFFEELGQVLEGREVVAIAGNHDHALVAPWLARRKRPNGAALGLEQRLAADASPSLALLARWLEPARLAVYYPGLWVRDDVYATHGHYLDCHMGITSGERLMIAFMRHLLRPKCRRPSSVDEYEAVTGPVYGRLDTSAALRRLAYSRMAVRLGRLLAGLSNEDLVCAERAAMGEVATALGIGDAYVVFGHTHRPGPFTESSPLSSSGRLGARLVNCGCWLEHALGTEARPRANAAERAGVTMSATAWRAPCVIVRDGRPPVAAWLDGGRLSVAKQGPEHA